MRTHDSEKPWILLVESHGDDRLLAQLILEREGFAVRAVARAKDGVSLLDERCFDLLLCEMEVDSEETGSLLQQVRAHPLHTGLPAIALCDYPCLEESKRAR